MSAIVFDSGPVISLTMNNLLWLLEPLKQSFQGEFYITEQVSRELIGIPMEIKRFEFEALQVQSQVDCKILTLVKSPQLTEELLSLSNNLFHAKGTNLNIVSAAEMSTLATVIESNAQAAVVDERTTRDLVENPQRVAEHLQRRLHTKVYTDKQSQDKLQAKIKDIKIIRSVELVAVAFELGLLDKYIDKCKTPTPELRKRLLDSVLWGVKMDGCAVTEEEIEQITVSLL